MEEPAQNLHWSASSGRLPRHEIVRQRRGECTRPRPAPWTAAWWRAGLPWAGSCWGPQSAEEEAEHLEVWSVAGARGAEGAVGAPCWSLGSSRDGRASWGSRGVWGRWSHPHGLRVVVSYQPTDPPAPIRASDTHTDFPDFGGILRIWVAVNLFLILCFLISGTPPRHPYAHSCTYTG